MMPVMVSVTTWVVVLALLAFNVAAMVLMYRSRNVKVRGLINLVSVLIFPAAIYKGMETLFKIKWLALLLTLFNVFYVKNTIAWVNIALLRNQDVTRIRHIENDTLIVLRAASWLAILMIPFWEACLVAISPTPPR